VNHGRPGAGGTPVTAATAWGKLREVTPTSSTSDKRRAFKQLHESGCFLLPNPWDVGSARLLQSLGFKALASTSAGLAWSRGRADGALEREQVLSHLTELVQATALQSPSTYSWAGRASSRWTTLPRWGSGASASGVPCFAPRGAGCSVRRARWQRGASMSLSPRLRDES